MLQLSRQDIEFISRRLLSEYLKKQITRIDKIDPVDFAEKMCGLRFAFADISVTGAVLGFTASMDVINAWNRARTSGRGANPRCVH